MKEISVYLDEYEFNCTITSYVNQPALGPWKADNPDDCYGYEEVEFDVDSVFVYNDDDGNLCEVIDKVEKENIISDYVGRIEGKILEEIREEAEDDFDEPDNFFQSDYYDGY